MTQIIQSEHLKTPQMCKWLENAITLFGMKINIKSHLSFIKMCVGSPNAQIRGAALNLIGTMSMYSGEFSYSSEGWGRGVAYCFIYLHSYSNILPSSNDKSVIRGFSPLSIISGPLR